MKWTITVLLVSLLASSSMADEGMWLFDRFPSATVKEKYGLEVSLKFLEDLRLATVRLGEASGAMVSPNGLMLANQHIFSACLTHDFLQNGFYASSPAEEKRCPGLDAKVLIGIEDVRDRAAAKARMESECA